MRISDWSSDVCSSDLGTVRTFRKETQDQLEQDLERIARGICDSQGATMTLRYERRYPALVNSEVETGIAAAAAARVVGEDKEIGRAHVCTPVTNAQLVCRLLLEKKKKETTKPRRNRPHKQR